MQPKILVVSPSKRNAQRLAKVLAPLQRGIVTLVGDEKPRQWDSFRLAVLDAADDDQGLLSEVVGHLRPNAHVISITPGLTVSAVAQKMRDQRANHFLSRPISSQDIVNVAEKLATGAIFGLERYLPQRVQVTYCKIQTFRERSDSLEAIDTELRNQKVRTAIRQSTLRALEELLMNAMYHAPVDSTGAGIFAEVGPKARLRRQTPRPVSLRFAVHNGSVCISVRDRFGSLQRSQLVESLIRCSQGDQIQGKLTGAGLGLYLIASTVSRFIVNLLPGGLTECIFTVEPTVAGTDRLRLFSFTSQRPLPVSLPRA